MSRDKWKKYKMTKYKKLLVKTETKAKVTFSYRKIHSVGLEGRMGQKDRNQSNLRKVPDEINYIN